MVPVLYQEKVRVGRSEKTFFSMIFSWFDGLNRLEMHNLLFRLRVFTMKIPGHKLVMCWLAYCTF